MQTSNPVGRLAPSPTGFLHLGHARSFLLAWWHARSRAGRVVLRIEDLDRERCKPELVDTCRRDLEWLGLDWDGEALVQSAATHPYQHAADDLVARGLAYPCTCSRAEIAALSAPHAEDREQRYPGTCRGKWSTVEHARRDSGRDPGLRLVVPDGALRVRDELRGEILTDVAAEVGDFLIRRRDGAFAYQLAVVVDDGRAAVTDVVRGDDLLSSAARQALLQRYLGYPSPKWWHVPLVVDSSGRRLSKRRGDLALANLREAGVDARAVVAWVARSIGSERGERLSPAELVERFDLRAIARGPALLDAAALERIRTARA